MPIPLYLHIPKCGGSTISSVVYQQCSRKTAGDEKNKYWHRGIYFYPAGLFSRPSNPSSPEVAKMLKRGDLRAVIGHFSFGIHRYVEVPSVYFTVLRNPVSRMLSLFDELTIQKRIEGSLDEFLSNPPFPNMENDQVRRIAGVNGSGMLETAKQNIQEHFALVGLTERMDETLCLMHSILGWKDLVAYYPRNVTLHRTDPGSVKPALLQRIAEQNALDIALYEFSQQELKKMIQKQGPSFPMDLEKYKEAVKNVIERATINSAENADNERVHEIVLNILNQGKSR